MSFTSPASATMSLTEGKDIDLTTVRDAGHIAIADCAAGVRGLWRRCIPKRNGTITRARIFTRKVAVFLINDDRDFKAVKGEDADGRFGRNRETYYGRWTYKFEQAAKRGAVAALIVHDTDAAGYGWSTVSASQGENYAVADDAAISPCRLQGWLEHDVASRLFDAAGLDLETLRKQARSAGFRPVPLKGVSFTVDLPVSLEHIESRNVLARLPGKGQPDESVMFGEHWDAYGIGRAGRPGPHNAPCANDDGAWCCRSARAGAHVQGCAEHGPQPRLRALDSERSAGCSARKYYAAHPVWPLAKTVANLTMDILQTAGPAQNVRGSRQGQFFSRRHYLEAAAKAEGRTVVPETFSERGLFYRADHFSVVRKGVPSLLLMALGGAPDLEQGGLIGGGKHGSTGI